MNPRVKSVEYKNGYNLVLHFENDEVKLFNFRDYLRYPVFKPLADETFCKKVRALDGIVQWSDEIDFDPDTLYLDSVAVK